jgi:hypothetical protein
MEGGSTRAAFHIAAVHYCRHALPVCLPQPVSKVRVSHRGDVMHIDLQYLHATYYFIDLLQCEVK